MGRREGAVFVPFGAPGDRAALERWEKGKNMSRAWIRSLAEASPRRIDPPCPVFFRPGAAPESVCGGCDWQHLAYPFQVESKRTLLVEAFQRIGRIAAPQVEATLSADDPWRYRNKVQIPFGKDPGGLLVAGFYAPGSHRVVPFDDCLVQSRESVAVLKSVLDWFRAHPAPDGWLRHLLVRTNARGEALAALVTRDASFPKARDFALRLLETCPAVKSLYHNVNAKPGNAVLGHQWRLLHGRPHLTETILNLKFRLSPGAFFQVHHAMAEKLYEKAAELCDPRPQEAVLELYAGVGAMGQLLAPRTRVVWAVEENAQAVTDGRESARWNGLENVRFVHAKCEWAIKRGLPGKDPGPLGAVLLDPPRAGCDERVLKAVMRMKPRRVVYVSCDPATLARDARYLSTGGYLLKTSIPVDLFPQTSHIESVSLFLPAG